MSVAKYKIELEWKDGLSVDLNAVDTWMRAHAGADYCGNQAHNKLELWFVNEPAQEYKDAIAAYWEAVDEHSSEVTSYKSFSDRLSEKASSKAAAIAALATASGLSQDQIKALLG